MGNEQKLREALQVGRDYAAEALAKHDQQYQRHPATEGERKLICDDLAQIEQALATTEPAVSQQLTTEPVDEREAFEKWLGIKPCGAAHDFGWAAWQARAAMAQVSDINVVESLTNDAKDAERYRWLADSNNYYEAINLISDGSLTEDALGKAIDAAKRKDKA